MSIPKSFGPNARGNNSSIEVITILSFFVVDKIISIL